MDKILLCSKNRFGENGSLLKVNDGRGPREKIDRRFPEGGSKRGNPTMTTSTITVRTKGDPQHYVEAKRAQHLTFDGFNDTFHYFLDHFQGGFRVVTSLSFRSSDWC